ncbi:hypothetical protein GOP47_0018483 [Adiantum capillus-veneris]|uniref:Uncharacterized protein n=1 Tax=Adiantum capillus-veneris TaxID=13818 RepID=A0A9D4Z8T8_ADICA|nr:hypothetical protein GOP47_0018483 [Adiantum capillus-veneris]
MSFVDTMTDMDGLSVEDLAVIQSFLDILRPEADACELELGTALATQGSGQTDALGVHVTCDGVLSQI